jgi:hypothetical protein
MSKLTGKTGISRFTSKKNNVKSNEIKEEKKEKITMVNTKRNVTTGSSPVPMRLTANDQAELQLWLTDLENNTGKKISPAKLMRGLIRMREKINEKKLIEAIKDAT